MRIGNEHYESIWLDKEDDGLVMIIDQRKLPFTFETMALRSVDEVHDAIKNMALRGAPLIGAAGAFGIYLACLEITNLSHVKDHLRNAASYLISSRPTAVNLEWAVKKQLEKLANSKTKKELCKISRETALEICENEKENCLKIGLHGLDIIREISNKKKGDVVNILTHCNAGWLACIDYGTAMAPIYLAHDKGLNVHVWVDETRPRNQGARLTAWELGSHGVPYTLITDNAGGHLMQKGMVDLVIVGSDRTTLSGDVANKTGTYLKALAAYDNKIPFYVALPTTTIDREIRDGMREVPVEQRSENEITHVEVYHNNNIIKGRICPENTKASNYGFDITPARLVTGLLTEKGVCMANEKSIKELFSE